MGVICFLLFFGVYALWVTSEKSLIEDDDDDSIIV